MPSDIEQALAEALHGECDPLDGEGDCDMGHEAEARAILATKTMQAIAREAAVGRAVLRLADSVAWTLRGGPDGSNTEAWNTQTGAVGSGDTIPAAIAAALGDDDA